MPQRKSSMNDPGTPALLLKTASCWFESNMQAAEIDYMLFAYDRMFNHIEDVLFPLGTLMALGSLECATVFTAALVKMKSQATGVSRQNKHSLFWTRTLWSSTPDGNSRLSAKRPGPIQIPNHMLKDAAVALSWTTSQLQQPIRLPLTELNAQLPMKTTSF